MANPRIRFWFWTVLSALTWIAAGFLIALRWQGGTAAFCGPFNSANTAAWVQAVGSLVAVGVAIYVPYKLAKNEGGRREAERALQARLLAARLLVPTLHLQFEAARLKVSLSPLPEGEDHSAPIYWSHGVPHRLDDVETIKREWGQLAVLNNGLADKVAILITMADGYNRRFDMLSRDAHHPLAPLRLAREASTLVDMAAAIEDIAKRTYEAIRQQSMLPLPEALTATPSWAKSP